MGLIRISIDKRLPCICLARQASRMKITRKGEALKKKST